MIKRVLLIKTSSMGDILHTLPAITDAAQAIPGIQFDWVVEENFQQIPSWHASVNEVIPVAIRRWRKHWFSQQTCRERKQFYEKLREVDYDAVIDAQGLLKSAILITRKARGLSHGYDWNSAREKIASWFYDLTHWVDKQQHAVERIRQLFADSLDYAYEGYGNYAIAHHFTHSKVKKVEPYVVFLHSTTRENKHWPEIHWRSLIKEVGKAGLMIKLPWGTEKEFKRARRLAEGNPHVEVLPELTLEEVARVLAGSCAVVSVDTGLSHLAAALNKLNITLYGYTDPGLIGGYGQHQVAIQSSDKDMSSILPKQVMCTLKAQGII